MELMPNEERFIDGGVEARLKGKIKAEEKKLGCLLGIPIEIIRDRWIGEAEMTIQAAINNRTHYIEITKE